MKLKKILFPFISILFGIFLALILSEMILRILPVRDSFMKLPLDSTNPVPRFKENRDMTWSCRYDFSIVTKKHINNYGFLNDQDYTPQDESPLLAIIGDSYVEAAQVENKNSMHGLLSQETKGKGKVYSFGMSGSPLSDYLAYAVYAVNEFNAKALVIIVVGNDFDESLTKYKNAPGFYYFSGLSDQLELIRIDYHPTLITRLLRRSALIRYMVFNLQLNWQSFVNIFNNDKGVAEVKFVGNTRSDFDEERISDSERAVNYFLEELPVRTGLGSDRILFIIDGMRPYIYQPEILMKVKGSYFDMMRKYFIRVAMKKGYEVIDLQPIFIKGHDIEGSRFEFPTDLHWNEAGHRLVAEKIKASDVYKRLFEK